MIVLAGNFFLRLAIVFLIAVCTLSHGLLYAQTVSDSLEPVSLIPNKILENKDVDKASDRNIDVLSEKEKTSEINDSSVEIKKLGEIDSDAVGISQRLDGQFLSNMWQGTSRDVAERLINNIPDRIASEAAQSLARRILLVAAAPPVNVDSNKSLVLARVKKLIALGAVEDAERLLRVVSASTVPENLIEPALRAHLLNSNLAGACEIASNVKTSFTSEFGQKVNVFCYLLNMQYDEALKGLESLREQNLAEDIMFFELSNSIISGATPTTEKLAVPGQATALNMALIRVVGGQVPRWFSEKASPSLLAAIASTQDADRQTRLLAAREAAYWGSLSPIKLASIYSELDISDEDVVGVLLDPDNSSPELRLAAIYLATISQEVSSRQAQILHEMWNLPNERKDWRLATKLTLQQLNKLEPSPVFSWFASEAIIASLVSGEIKQAIDWFWTISSNRKISPDVSLSLTNLWPVLRMASGDGLVSDKSRSALQRVYRQSGIKKETNISVEKDDLDRKNYIAWDNKTLKKWISLQKSHKPARVESIINVLSIFDALGEQVPDEFRLHEDLEQPSSLVLPPLNIWVELLRASSSGKVAETALYVLLATGQKELSELHPIVLHTIVRALTRVGLTNDARLFALEFTLATSY